MTATERGNQIREHGGPQQDDRVIVARPAATSETVAGMKGVSFQSFPLLCEATIPCHLKEARTTGHDPRA